MAYFYPSNLVDQIKERWNRYHGPRKVRVVATGPRLRRPRKEVIRTEPGPLGSLPFPSDRTLLAILEAIYHSSFLLEEGRRIALRVAYLPPDLPPEDRDRVLNHQGTVTRLLQPRPLSPSELLRLAPAVDPSQSMLLISDGVELKNIEQATVVWGLLHLGSEWRNLVSGRDTAASCPPNTVTVSTSAPGELVVSSGGHVLLRLRNGTLPDASAVELSEGAIGEFLKPAADAVYAEACATLKRSRFASDNSDEHPRQQYYLTLLNILRRTEERHHGGSFVIVPDELDISDARLTDRLSIKYSVDAPEVWPDLVRESVSTADFYAQLFPEGAFGSQRRARARKHHDREALYRASQRLDRLHEKIRDFELFASSLSGVDGVVVLTKRLKILGFGGEIMATSPTLSTVRLAGEGSGKVGPSVPITAFGTRHRSAFRFCSSFEDAVCFVVSQDGQVKAVKRVGPHVIMWSDLLSREEVL